jgi:potassium efflux system protein
MALIPSRADQPRPPSSEPVVSAAARDASDSRTDAHPPAAAPTEGETGSRASEAAGRPEPEKPSPEKGAAAGTASADQSDAKVARAETQEALKRLGKPSEQDTPATAATNKALRDVLEDRLRWLDEWDKVKEEQARHDAEPSAERHAASMKADLERLKAILEQSSREPESLLAGAFRNPSGPVTDATRAEMKEALEAAKNDWNDWKTKLEKLRAATQGASSNLSPRRVARDQTYQRLAALKPRKDEREAALGAAKTADESQLARERLGNLTWETRVESERLILQESLLAREAAAADLKTLELQVLEAHAQLAARAFEGMQKRYGEVTDDQARKLDQAAASEQKRAAQVDDPLEKFRARRTAELLELQAQVLQFENSLATNPHPALDEQRRLADAAVADFAGVKALIDDGKVSHLDALRLNNDFRRIGPERASIVSHELAIAASQLTFYENALNGVEMDLINGSRDDRLQNEDLRQRLSPKRYSEAQAVFAAIDARHLALLERKRLALEKLAARAEETHRQIERRLKTLDDQYGFILTHIFWVRDQEPLGAVTLAQCRREGAVLGRSLLPLLQEACDRSLWGRVSPEFVVAVFALIALPWPLSRLRRRTEAASAQRPTLENG